MAKKTNISWTDASWNPVRGCTRVSEGCRNCYAEHQAWRIVRMGNGKPTPYDGLVKLVTRESRQFKVGPDGDPTGEFRTVRLEEPRWTGRLAFDEKTLKWPLRRRKGLRIFVNSMSDLFHESLTNEQIAALFGVMAACPQHTFQILTKRSGRMREWFAWVARERDGNYFPNHEAAVVVKHAEQHVGPLGATCAWPLPNVWIGVSVENQEAADERIPDLLATPAAVRFLSCEPLLEAVDIRRWLPPAQPAISWVIAGCES